MAGQSKVARESHMWGPDRPELLVSTILCDRAHGEAGARDDGDGQLLGGESLNAPRHQPTPLRASCALTSGHVIPGA